MGRKIGEKMDKNGEKKKKCGNGGKIGENLEWDEKKDEKWKN